MEEKSISVAIRVKMQELKKNMAEVSKSFSKLKDDFNNVNTNNKLEKNMEKTSKAVEKTTKEIEHLSKVFNGLNNVTFDGLSANMQKAITKMSQDSGESIDSIMKRLNQVGDDGSGKKFDYSGYSTKELSSAYVDAQKSIADYNLDIEKTKAKIQSLTDKNKELKVAMQMCYNSGEMKQLQAQFVQNTRAINASEKAILNFKDGIKNAQLDAQVLKEELNGLEKPANNIGNLVNAAAVVMATKKLASLGAQAVKTNAQIKSTMQITKNVFGSVSNDINNFVDSNASALGMSKQTARDMANSYGMMTKDMGASVADSEKITKQLMATTSTLAQNTGYSMEETKDAIKSALTGSAISMDRFGIEMKTSALEATEAFKKMSGGKKFEQLDYETQSLIRAMALMEKTTRNYGDTAQETANTKLLSLSASLQNAKNNMSEILGEALVPLTNLTAKFARVIEIVTDAFKALSPETRGLILALAGILFSLTVLPIVFVAVGKAITYARNKLIEYSAIVTGVTSQHSILSFVMSKTFLKTVSIIMIGLAILSEAFGGLGNVFSNIGDVIIATLNYIGGSVVYTVGKIINVIGKLFGQDWGAGVTKAGEAMMDSARSTASRIKGSGSKNKNNKSAIDTSEEAGNATKAMNKLTDAQKDNAKQAGKTAKANKELKDNLQGFDEINKISPDEVSPSGGGDVGGPSIPKVSVPGMGGIGADIGNIKDKFKDVTKNIEEFKDKLKKVIPIITAIGVAFGAWKLINLIKDIFSLGNGLINLKNIGTVGTLGELGASASGATSAFSGLSSILIPATLGLGMFAGAQVGANEAFKAGNVEAERTITALGGVSAGMATAGGAILTGATALTGGIAGAVVAVGGLIAGMVLHNKRCAEVKKSITDVQGATENLKQATDIYDQTLDANINAVDRQKQAHDDLVRLEKENKVSGEALEQQVKNGTLTYAGMTAGQREVYKAYLNNKRAQEDVKKTTENLDGATKTLKRSQLEQRLAVLASEGKWDEYKQTLTRAKKQNIIDAGEMRDHIEKACTHISKAGRQAFVEDLPGDVKNGLDPNKYDTFSFKSTFEGIFNGIKETASKAFEWIKRWWNNWRPGKKSFSAEASGNGEARKMAIGGVVKAQPGGIIANIGEGRYDEAVVPLGNSPQMRNMKEDIANAVLQAMPRVENGGGVKQVELNFTLDGNVSLGKKLINLIDETEAYTL